MYRTVSLISNSYKLQWETLCVCGVFVCVHGYNVLLSPLTLKYLQMVSKVREMAPILRYAVVGETQCYIWRPGSANYA